MAADICYTPAVDLARQIRRGDRSPIEVVDAFIERIHQRNDTINAYTELFENEAREHARAAEQAVTDGEELGPLHGVPIAVKDNIALGGKRFTHGSVPLAENVADEDDLVVTRLKEAGVIVLGKTNLPEFATKGVTDNRLFGATGNPFDPDRMSGGSSGGSAAAAADGMAALALATDGGGSARIPASACGVYGMKPSFGRIPVPLRPDGFVHHTPMRARGPQARTVEDAAVMIDVMAGPHPSDPFTLPDTGVDYVAATRQSIADLEIAYSTDLGAFPIDERVRTVFEDAVDDLHRTGATLTDASPAFEHSRAEMLESWATGFHAVLAETMANLKDEGLDLLGDHRDELEPSNVEAAEIGLALSAVEYRQADIVRTAVFETIQDLFDECDLLATPTLAVPPFEHGIWGPEEVAGEEIDPTFGWCLTWLFNLTGHPAASVPAGFTDDGLPVGMQLVGPRFADETVLAASGAFERIAPWHDAYDTLA